MNEGKLRPAEKDDLGAMVKVALNCFTLDCQDKSEWEDLLGGGLAASPRLQYWVVEKDDQIVGYISWILLGGTQSGVIELDQIGVISDFRGGGFGKKLVLESLAEMTKILRDKYGVSLRVVKVDTAAGCPAEKFYEKVLGAKTECVLKDFFYGSDEALMIKRY